MIFLSQQLLPIPVRCTQSIGFAGLGLARHVQRFQFARFTGSLTLFDGRDLVEEVVVRVSWCASFTGSLTQPEYHREEIRKRIDGEDQPGGAEKDTREDEEPYEDERPQEECIYRGLAHRNECVSRFLKKVSNGHSCDLAFLEPHCSMAVCGPSFASNYSEG
jgi:hypothetical protein